MSGKPFYLTTTLPYVNADPHIGFALEIIAADVICRWQASQGRDVFFNTGTDEHGQKIYENACAAGKEPQAYVDEYAAVFRSLKTQLNLFADVHFIRTTDPQHRAAAQEIWKRCQANGDIYKAQQTINYCVGCELEKQSSELEDGRCPLHPNKELVVREEENYFFRFSDYEDKLLELYKSDTFVRPASKQKEITAFVAGGLRDFSISRLKDKMPWGVPVPGDDDHVMYVWFDALTSYISTLGWPKEGEGSDYKKYWESGAVQLAGKDNLRQQSAMWQAMLLSAGLEPSKQILINGFISVDGQKMSKSLGNVISPADMINRYGVDATRFLIMNLGPFGTDMDVSWEKFDTTYTAVLSNSIGNTCSRIAALAQGMDGSQVKSTERFDEKKLIKYSEMTDVALSRYNIAEAVVSVQTHFSEIEQLLSEEKPWLLSSEEKQSAMKKYVASLQSILPALSVFMPQTALALKKHFSSAEITKLAPLFPRLEK